MLTLLLLPVLLLLFFFGCSGRLRFLHSRIQKLYTEIRFLEGDKGSVEQEIVHYRRQTFAQVEAEAVEQKKVILIDLNNWCEQEKVRILQRMEAERVTLLRSLETEVAAARDRRIAQEEAVSLEKKQAAVTALNLWAGEEKNRIQEELERERDRRNGLLEKESAALYEQKLAQMNAGLAEDKKAAQLELGQWVLTQQHRLQQEIDRADEKQMQSLAAKRVTAHEEALARLETELHDQKKAATMALDGWVVEEKNRREMLLDAEAEACKGSLAQEMDAQQQRLAEGEAEVVAQKKAVLAGLSGWSEQEKGRIQQQIDAERTTHMQLLDAEVLAVRAEKIAQEEAESTRRKQAVIAELGLWMEGEKSRLRQHLDAESEARSGTLTAEMNERRQQMLAEGELEVVAQKKAVLAGLSDWSEQEKGRIQQQIDAERTIYMQLLDAEVEGVRADKIAQEEAESTQRKQAATIELGLWMEGEKSRLRQHLDAESEARSGTLTAEMKERQQQMLAEGELEVVAQKKAMLASLIGWSEQEKVRIQQQIDVERTAYMQSLPAEVEGVRAEKIAQEEAESTRRKQAAITELGLWMEGEKSRLRQHLDAESEARSGTLTAEMNERRQQMLAEVEASVAEQKKTVLAGLTGWSEQEKVRIQQQIDAERTIYMQLLDAEVEGVRAEKIAQEEAESAQRKQAAITELGLWMEGEKSRLRQPLDAELEARSGTLTAEMNERQQQRLAEVEAFVAEQKQAAIARLSAWEEQENDRIRVMCSAEQSRLASTAEEALETHRQQILAAIDAESAERRAAAAVELSAWIEWEKAHVRALIDSEHEQHECSLEAEPAADEMAALPAVEENGTATKRSAMAYLGGWMTREKKALFALLNPERGKKSVAQDDKVAADSKEGEENNDAESKPGPKV